jgi:peptide chain release factor subunit 1
MPSAETLVAHLDRLATFDSGPYPVVSLYLNMQPDQRGRDNFELFLRRELTARVRSYRAGSIERDSLDRDVEKIHAYVTEVDPSANGLAVFACAGADLFQPLPLAAPIDEHRLYIAGQPHLYPLARALGAHPRYAVLLADTNRARIFVVAAYQVQEAGEVAGVKTRRHKMGGWSQARYQRHIDNYHLLHAKEVVDTMARVVREEGIGAVIIAGDEVIVPLLKEQMPKDIAERVVDVMSLDIRTPEHEVLATTIAAMREKDAETDRERVEALLGAYRANGLAVVGREGTSGALDLGQVEELLIAADPGAIDAGAADEGPGLDRRVAAEGAADRLVVKARQTAARIRFIEDASLLATVGGVGAFLRFKL